MARVLRPGDGRGLELAGRTARELLAGGPEEAGLTVRVVEIAPEPPGGPGRPLHVHRGVGEFVFILAGTGVLIAPGGRETVAAGDAVVVPPDERHKIAPTGDGPMTVLCVFACADLAARTDEA